MAKYTRHYARRAGEWSRWVSPVQGHDEPAEEPFKLSCCDCGLVHDIDFRVTGAGKVLFRFARNHRSTGQVRRHMRRERA